MLERFWDKVDKTPGYGPEGTCWIWTAGTRGETGYGAFKLEGKTIDAHRLSFKIFTQIDIPGSIFVCHDCDVRSCVNPAHLFAGREIDNVRDMISKNRQAVRIYTRSEIHGTSIKYRYGCRCNICRLAHNERVRLWHHKKRCQQKQDK